MENHIRLATDWAQEMATACQIAHESIFISAISLQPPRRQNNTPFSNLWESWKTAAARGILVQFFLPVPSQAHPATARNGIAAAIAHDAGMKTRFVPQPNLMHAKSVLIDRKTVWIGSGNMTAAAAHFNHEIYISFDSPQIAEQILSRWQNISNPE